MRPNEALSIQRDRRIPAGCGSSSPKKGSRCRSCRSISAPRSNSPTPMPRSIRAASCRRWCLDDGTAIGEVPAILRYLEEIHPEPPLLGMTPKTKAQVAMWERRVEQEGFASVMEAVRNSVPGSQEPGHRRAARLSSRFRRWSSEANSASEISTPISMPGSPMCRLSREMCSRSPISPPSSPSTSRPRRPAFRSRTSMRP